MAQVFQIRLDGTANTAAWVSAQGVLKNLDSQARQFLDSLRAGVGIDLGGRLVSSLAALPNVFSDTLKRGFEFNKTLGDSEVAISNVLQKFQGLDQAAGDLAAANAIQKIVELEPLVAGTLGDLTRGFLASAAAAQAAGLSVEQNIDLVGKFANGLANANIPAEQLTQEIRAVFSGNITPDAAFAKILGLTNEMVRSAKEAGTLYEVLSSKIGKLGEAGDTAGVALSTLQSAMDKASGILAKPLFDAVIEGVKEFSGALGDPVIAAALEDVGVKIGELTKTGLDLTKWALANAPALLKVGESILKVGGAVAAIKFAALIAGLARSVTLWGTSTFAVRANSAALAQNAAAATTAAGAQGTAAAASAAAAASVGGTAGVATATAFSSRFIGALPGLLNAAGVGLVVGLVVKVALDAAFAAMDQAATQRLEQTKAALGKKSLTAVSLDLIVRADTPQLQAQARRFAQDSLDAVNKAIAEARQNRDSQAVAILSTEKRTLENQLRDFQTLAGKLAETNPTAFANEAEAKQRAYNRTLDELAASAGDAEAELRLLNTQYGDLLEKITKLLGLKAPVAGFTELKGLIKPDTGNSEDGAKAIELLKTLGELHEKVAKKTDDIARKREDDNAKQRQAENELLEFKVRALEAAGSKASATNARVILEARQLAEQLFNAGTFGSFDEAFEGALAITRKEAEGKRDDDARKIADARQLAGIEDQIARLRGEGREKEAEALQDQERVLQLARQLEDSLKISRDEALRRAQERVDNERRALDIAKQNTGEQSLQLALARREKEVREGGTRRVDFDEAERRRDAARKRAQTPSLLDEFYAQQNDPRRNRPVSSVPLPASFVGAPAPGQTIARQPTNNQGAGNLEKALTDDGRVQEVALLKLNEELVRLASAQKDKSQIIVRALEQNANTVRAAIAQIRAEQADLRRQIATNRT